METFHIEVRETLSKIIEVEASSSKEAIERVKDRYHADDTDGDKIVLTADDFDGDTEFFDQTGAI
jgi:hypothetical protein